MPKHIFEFRLIPYQQIPYVENIYVKLQSPETKIIDREKIETLIIRGIHTIRPEYGIKYGYLDYIESDRISGNYGLNITTNLVVYNFLPHTPENYDMTLALMAVMDKAISHHWLSKTKILDYKVNTKPIREPLLTTAKRLGVQHIISEDGQNYTDKASVLDVADIQLSRIVLS